MYVWMIDSSCEQQFRQELTMKIQMVTFICLLVLSPFQMLLMLLIRGLRVPADGLSMGFDVTLYLALALFFSCARR